MKNSEIYRCKWAQGNQFAKEYHDKEWGVPLHNDKKLFEFLVLDAFQAGLSWNTILKKRQNFREAFDDFTIIKFPGMRTIKLANCLILPIFRKIWLRKH